MAKKTLFLPSRGDGRMSASQIAQAADLAKDVPIPPQRNPFARPPIPTILAPGLPGSPSLPPTTPPVAGVSGGAAFSRISVSNGVVVSVTGPYNINKTAAYSVTSIDDVIFADTTSAGFTLTLPLASVSNRSLFYFENIGTNTLTIAASGSDVLSGITTLPAQFDGSWYYSE